MPGPRAPLLFSPQHPVATGLYGAARGGTGPRPSWLMPALPSPSRCELKWRRRPVGSKAGPHRARHELDRRRRRGAPALHPPHRCWQHRNSDNMVDGHFNRVNRPGTHHTRKWASRQHETIRCRSVDTAWVAMYRLERADPGTSRRAHRAPLSRHVPVPERGRSRCGSSHDRLTNGERFRPGSTQTYRRTRNAGRSSGQRRTGIPEDVGLPALRD